MKTNENERLQITKTILEKLIELNNKIEKYLKNEK